MSWTRQLNAVVTLGLKSLPQRIGGSSVVILCVAVVVMVMLGVLSMSHSLARTIGSSGRPDRAVLLSEGAELEGPMSAIPRDALAAVEQLPGIRRDAQGKAVVSAEVHMYLPVRERKDEARARIVVRGVGPEAGQLRPEVVITRGRMLQTGINELIVGREALRRFKGLDVGDTVKLRNVPFVVVGVFESGGDAHESEHDKRRVIDATALLELVAYLVGTIMAAAASFSVANTLYSAVSARRTEIATLRAIGFGSSSVVVAILVESLILALIGAAIGVLLTSLAINGQQFDSGAISTQLHIDSTLIAIGIAWACGIALVSAVAPAIHAARMPIARALREG
jgi:putative ABC transport system permease protein